MHIKRRSVLVILGSLLVFAASGCGMRSNLDEGDSIEEITAASAMDSGVKASDESEADESYCGDGRLDLQNGEQCDGANVGYASCESLGHGTGTLLCSPACYFDVSGCYIPQTTQIDTQPGTNQTMPVGGNSAYGADPFSAIIDWAVNNPDTTAAVIDWMMNNSDTTADDNASSGTNNGGRFGGRNTEN